MITSSSSFPTSPSGSSTSSTDYTSSSTDDAMGIGSGASSAGSMSSMNPSSTSSSGRPEALDRALRGAHDTVDRLADKAEPQLQRLQDGVASATDMADEWADSLRCTVRENPLAAVATALALGLIVARLSR